MIAEIEANGYTLEEVSTNYKKRLMYNIDVLLDWAENYKYKGPKKFKSHKLF